MDWPFLLARATPARRQLGAVRYRAAERKPHPGSVLPPATRPRPCQTGRHHLSGRGRIHRSRRKNTAHPRTSMTAGSSTPPSTRAPEAAPRIGSVQCNRAGWFMKEANGSSRRRRAAQRSDLQNSFRSCDRRLLLSPTQHSRLPRWVPSAIPPSAHLAASPPAMAVQPSLCSRPPR